MTLRRFFVANDYLTKPVDIDLVLLSLRRAIGKRVTKIGQTPNVPNLTFKKIR